MFLLMIIIFKLACSANTLTSNLKITSGVYFQEQPQVLPYETSLPLLFELDVIVIPSGCNVNGVDKAPSWGEQVKLLKNPLVPIFTDGKDKKILYTDGESAGWDFQLVTRNHVKSIYASAEEFEKFKETLIKKPYNFEIFSSNLGKKDCAFWNKNLY